MSDREPTPTEMQLLEVVRDFSHEVRACWNEGWIGDDGLLTRDGDKALLRGYRRKASEAYQAATRSGR